MPTTPAQEAIAVLINLAQQGEIDPWDVQVIEVIDRFLSELGLPHDIDSAHQQANLSQSGQAFLWASMLVLLKANTLERLELDEDAQDVSEEVDALELENTQQRLATGLERHIRRRSAAPPPRRRRVTLQELIEQIQQIAATLEETPSRSRESLPRPQSRREVTRIIAQLAHQENLTEVAAQLEQFLLFKLPELAPEQTCFELDNLLGLWTKATASSDEGTLASVPDCQRHPPKSDRVGIFWALLLLCSQSKVELSQSEFYQDLKIQVLN